MGAVAEVILVGLVIGLPLYNFLANRWPPFNAALFVPMNLTLTALILIVGFGPLELSRQQIFGDASLRALGYGLILGAAVTLPVFVVSLWRRGVRWVRDERVADLRGGALAYQVLVRIPLGTALLEEVAFRGVLFAAWRGSGDLQAALASSIVFGLWHVGPTINAVRANRPDASTSAAIKAIAGAVLFTTLAGLVFSWLRAEVGLLGPLVMHAVVNGLATIASVMAARRLQPTIASRR